MPAQQVRSGEERWDAEAGFRRVPDPRKPDAELAEEGWQQALAGSMAEALKQGQEQVVLMFTRDGCPWCEKQVPVLQRAIQARAGASAAVMPTPGAAVAFTIGGDPTPSRQPNTLLYAPIRVFILDATEFPVLIQGFKVEAFPTLLVFGAPGVNPLPVQGYVDDDNLEQILRSAATAIPAPGALGEAGGKPGKKRGLFR